MAIQLEPVELDISDALNDIDTLKEHIEEAFKTHGASDDPRMERLLQQMRNVYDTLNDLEDRMGSIHFDPTIDSSLESIRNDISEVSIALQQSQQQVALLSQEMQNMHFDPTLNMQLESLDARISSTTRNLEDSRDRMAKLQPDPELTEEFNHVERSIESISQRLAEAQERMRGIDLSGIDWSKTQGDANAEAYLQEQALIKQLQTELKALYDRRKELQQIPSLNPESAKMMAEEEAKIKELEDRLTSLQQKKAEVQSQVTTRDAMEEALNQENQTAQNLTNTLEGLRQEEAQLQAQQTAQYKLGDDFQKAAESATILEQRLNQLSPPVQRANSLLIGMQHIIQSVQAILSGVLNVVKSIFSKIGVLAKEVGSKIKSVMSSLLAHVKSVARHIGKSLSSKFSGLGKSASGLTNTLEGGFKKALKTLLRYGLGVRSLFFLFRKLRSAAIEMLGEMSKQIPEVNKQMSSLKQSMNQMKGALATAIQPLLNILVPILQKVSAMVTSLMNKIGSFFALLTGQKFIYTATAGAVNYADSLEKTGKKAKKAKKELEGYLSPIDEINKYQTQAKEDEDDSGTDASGGVSFKKTPISDKMKELFDWLKKMWEKGDFTELGKMLGDKLAKALASIPWDKIKAVARKLGSSLATLINGFIQGEFDKKSVGWWIGHTLAEGLNTAFEFLNKFVHKLNWRGIGKFIADTFNGLFDGIDWDLIYDTIVTGLRGIGDAIWDFITNFKWDSIYKFIKNAIHTIADGIKALFSADGYDERGFKLNGSWVQRLGKELGAQFRQLVTDGELMSDIGETIGILIKNIYDFIVSFIKEAFSDKEGISGGIHSFIEGILTGLGLSDEEIDGAMSWVDKVGGWFDKIITWISTTDWQDVWNTVTETISNAWDIISDIWDAAEPIIDEIWDAVQPLLEELGEQLIQFLKDLPGYLEDIRNSEEFKSFIDWLSQVTWDDIKDGIESVGNALKVLAGILAGLKIGKAVWDISRLVSTFKQGKQIKDLVSTLSSLKGGGAVGEVGEVMSQDIQILDPDTLAPMSTKKTLATRIGDIIKGAVNTVKTSFGAGGFMNTVLFGDIGANVAAGGATAGATIGASIVGGIVAFFGGAEVGKKLGGWIFPEDSELYEGYSGIMGTLEMVKDLFVGIKDFVIMTWEDLTEGSTEKFELLTEWILRIALPFTNGLFDAFHALKDKVIEVWNTIKDKVIEKFDKLKEKFEDFKSKVSDFKQSVVDKFNALKDAIQEKVKFIKQKFEDFKTALAEKWEAIKTKIEEFKTAIVEKWEFIKSKVSEFKENVANKIEEFKTALAEKWEAIKQGVEEFKEKVVEKFEAFKQKIEEFKEGVKEKFEAIKKNFIQVFEDIKNGIKEPINGIIGFVEKFINKIIDGFNGLGEKLGKLEFKTPDWLPDGLGGKEFKIGLPEIGHVSLPRLAQGAVIPPNKQFMAMLGDQKQGVNIETPLATMVDAFNQALAMNGGGNQSITLNLMLPDKRTVAQYCIEGGQVLQMSRGANPFLLERG